MTERMKNEIESLIGSARDVMVCSVDGQGYPNVKAMFNIAHEGLKTFYLSTNTSSLRVGQFMKNPKSSLYFCNHELFQGFMLIGNMEVLQGDDIKHRFWQEGWEMYYPLGVTDPDYCILRFTAQSGNYYHNLQKQTFNIT